MSTAGASGLEPGRPRYERAGRRAAVSGGIGDKALFLCLAGAARLVTSEVLLEELYGVLTEKFGASAKDGRAAIAFVRGVAEVVTPGIVLDVVAADPDDNAVLECAVWAEVDLVVTGDKAHLLPLKAFRGIDIVTPRQFVDRFS